MAEAREKRQGVIIDFHAEWCTPCRELENVTFHDPGVTELAEESFVMVKVDLTKKGNAVYEGLLKKYEIKGVPTVVFLDERGSERRDLRLVDFLPPDRFLGRMNQLADSRTMGESD